MSSIGGVSVDFIYGLPQLLRPRIIKYEVPGIDGYGVQVLGSGGGEFNVRVIAFRETSDLANMLIDDITAQQGTVVSVTDDWGDEYDDVLIENVATTEGKKGIIFRGSFGVLVKFDIKMCITQMI